MKLQSTFAAALLVLAAVSPPGGSATAQDAVDPEDMVNAINGTYGSHKGYRAVHAKGFCGAGTLTAAPGAAEYTKSTLFDGHAVPTMFRFSLAPGVPDSSDTVQAPRSLVARMEDADGTSMDLIMINVPFVFVKDPADFAPFFRAIAPDPATGKADPAKVKAHFDKHPEAARFVEFLEKSPIPASYATSPFYAVHTFYFTNAQGERRPARWTAEPVAGRAGADRRADQEPVAQLHAGRAAQAGRERAGGMGPLPAAPRGGRPAARRLGALARGAQEGEGGPATAHLGGRGGNQGAVRTRSCSIRPRCPMASRPRTIPCS